MREALKYYGLSPAEIGQVLDLVKHPALNTGRCYQHRACYPTRVGPWNNSGHWASARRVIRRIQDICSPYGLDADVRGLRTPSGDARGIAGVEVSRHYGKAGKRILYTA
jgi:hypothetical protein